MNKNPPISRHRFQWWWMAVLLLPTFLFADTTGQLFVMQEDITGATFVVELYADLRPLDIADLPAADGTHGVAYVVDAANDMDCTVGLRSIKHLCLDNGTEWVPVGADIQEDAISTVELDDGVDTPIAGDLVSVATGAVEFEYLTQSSITAGLATSLAANGGNCSVGFSPLGVDALGAVEGCFDVATQAELDSVAAAESDDQDGTEVPYTPTIPTDWADPDPTNVAEALDTVAADPRWADDRDPTAHADDHSLGNSDPVTATNLASGCTDAQVLGGTSAGTGVECQADQGAVSSGSGLQKGDGSGGLVEVPDSSSTLGDVTLGGGIILADFSDAGGIALAFASETNTGLWLQVGTGMHLRKSGSDLITLVSTPSRIGMSAAIYDSALSVTCSDSGDASPGSMTIVASNRSYVEITNSDPHGCLITMSETAISGQRVELVVISNAGGTVDFSDSSGVTELSGAFLAELWDSITLRYVVDRWVESTRSDN